MRILLTNQQTDKPHCITWDVNSLAKVIIKQCLQKNGFSAICYKQYIWDVYRLWFHCYRNGLLLKLLRLLDYECLNTTSSISERRLSLLLWGLALSVKYCDTSELKIRNTYFIPNYHHDVTHNVSKARPIILKNKNKHHVMCKKYFETFTASQSDLQLPIGCMSMSFFHGAYMYDSFVLCPVYTIEIVWRVSLSSQHARQAI